jgi:hypothetical protein
MRLAAPRTNDVHPTSTSCVRAATRDAGAVERLSGDARTPAWFCTPRGAAARPVSATGGAIVAVRRVALLLACALAGTLVASSSALAASVEAESVSVTDVSSSSATLNATIDPEGAETSYVFEYAKSPYEGGATPGGSVEVGAGSAGSGETGVPVSAHVQGLEPSTTYYYRLVVAGVNSQAGSLTTQESGDAFALPEGREWELVSPPNKHGAGIEPFSVNGSVIEAAEDGGAFTYVTDGAPVSEPEGNRAFELSQALSTRAAGGGWSTQDIATPNAGYSPLEIGHFTEYDMFSSDLSRAVVEPKGDTPLPPLPSNAEETIYLRDDKSGVFTPLVTAENVIPGAKFGEEDDENLVHFQGASPDLSHVIVSSPEALTEGSVAPAFGEANLYEWAGGRLRPVNILPRNAEGKEEPDVHLGPQVASRLGNTGFEGNARGAVSTNGERVVWTADYEAEAGGLYESLYLRDMSRRETIQLDLPEAGLNPGRGEPQATFQGASSANSDGPGMRIFFTDAQRLTSVSHAEYSPDLYVFEVTSGEGEPLAGKVTDLTTDSNGEESAVRGDLIGYSEDGSYVYFVAAGKLAEGAESGANNLYVEHRGSGGWEAPRLIAKLSGEDSHDWANTSNLAYLTARVSPNGEFLAFMSQERLTGYDNRDVSSGAADQEVFVYDAATGKLACASCAPTAARPEGLFDPPEKLDEPRPLIDYIGLWEGKWLAGSVPGWDPAATNTANYQPRYLSDSGELFFDSPSALVPAVVDGEENVFSYRPAGEDCSRVTQSAAEVFKPATGSEPAGCVSLISSGTSSHESAFLDASASGQDVFFMTTSQLVPKDLDSAYDVYDAHVCTGESPCAEGAGSVPPACSTADSCRAAPAPQPSIFGAPASSTFSGSGNVSPSTVTVAAKKKTIAQLKAEDLAKALNACRKKHNRAKRVTCEGQVRKRYGAGKAKKSNAKRVSGERGVK